MKKLYRKLRELSRTQQILLFSAVILGLAVVLRYVEMPDRVFPLPHTINAKEEELQKFIDTYHRLHREREKYGGMVDDVRRQLASVIWQMDGKVPSATLQSELENVARKAHVTIQTTGGRDTAEISEHLRSVQSRVRLNGTMREITRFLKALERDDKRFVWHSCQIRPANAAGASTVNLSGRIKVFFLTPEAENKLMNSEG